MQDVDLVGIDSVCEYIRHSQMNYYYIHKYPSQSGSLSVYECTRAQNSNAAAIDFHEWSNIMNKGGKNFLQYQITITNYKEEDEDKPDVKRVRKNKMRASFVFYKTDEQPTQHNQNRFIAEPVGNFQGQLDEKINALRTELTLKHENEKLQERIEDLEEELDEIGEVDEQPHYIEKLITLLAGDQKKKEPAKATLSGITDKKESLNKSINTLLKYDNELPMHLEKLAHLAETNTAKFRVLIQMIDTQL